jgi:hypothetical protein
MGARASDDAVGVIDKAGGELGDMHQAIPMHANVDESAEGGHIGDFAIEHHAWLKVLDVSDLGMIGKGFYRSARVAPGLLQLGENILYGEQANPCRLIHEGFRLKM